MELLDGKTLSRKIKGEVREKIAAMPAARRPKLALVQVAENPASSVYVRGKIRSCEECGIESHYIHLQKEVEENALLRTLKDLSTEPSVHGILLQLPLPDHINEEKAIALINPVKDVDGFHPENLGLLVSGSPRFVPCTPLGIREMLLRYGVETEGKRVVVLGRSVIVGKTLSLLLSLKGEGANATVTLCHSRTPDLPSISASADILIAAMGKPLFVTADMVKDGAVVVDVGINRIEDKTRKKGYRLAGDVDFEQVSPKASFITPVPGGVGPMTIAMLMVNTLKAFTLQAGAQNVFC